jgi:hypothetical protein
MTTDNLQHVIPLAGSDGVNLRSQPGIDDSTRVGFLPGGAALELENEMAPGNSAWRSCRVYVSMQLVEASGDQFVQLRPGALRSNIRLAPDLSDNTDVGDLLPSQRLELIQAIGDWWIARVYVAAQFSQVVAAGATIGPAAITTSTSPSNGAATFIPPTLTNTALGVLNVQSLSLAPPQTLQASGQTVVRIWNRYGGLLEALAAQIGIDPGAAVAVMVVESSGNAFGADRRMIIRFENHIFWAEWGRNNPATYNEHFTRDPHQYRTSAAQPWQPTHTGSQASEWAAFTLAMSLNPTAAKRSISMGLGQIMGFNFARLGYPSVDAMFDALGADERWQVLGLFSFIATDNRLVQALRQGDYTAFARGYNGDSPAAVGYGQAIQRAREGFNALLAAQGIVLGAGVPKELELGSAARPRTRTRTAHKAPARKVAAPKVAAKKAAKKTAAKKTTTRKAVTKKPATKAQPKTKRGAARKTRSRRK